MLNGMNEADLRHPLLRWRPSVARAIAPHWAALLMLALFLIAGLAALDDYGVSADEVWQRNVGFGVIGYVRGQVDALLDYSVQFDSVAFVAPLLATEPALGLTDSRSIHLAHHLAVHLFFLIGGGFAYFLARRLFRNRLIALFAMLLFLLHPRLYAHSFFNSKDIPFLVMFIVTLYLTHRAFKRDTVAAFLLLGAAAGALVNLRIMGVVLFAAVSSMRLLDFAFAQGRAERKRILVTTGAFALAGFLMAYALMPYLWANPVGRAVEWWAVLSEHPTNPVELFRGTLYRSADFPSDYIPVWIAISSPLFALTLGLAGAASVLAKWIRSPLGGFRSARLRFGALLLGCFALPILAAVQLDINFYNGWRHAYYLWAPFALLGAYGLAWFISALRRARLRLAIYAAAGAGLATTLISMALLHPNQQLYFNALVDRTTQDHLRTQYVMDYWGHATRREIERLLEESPIPLADVNWAGSFLEPSLSNNVRILPRAERGRIVEAMGLQAFPVSEDAKNVDLALRQAQVYGSAISTIERKADLRPVYEETLRREPILDSFFDVHQLDDGLALVKEPCAPSYLTRQGVRLSITPVDADDLPYWRRARGFEIINHSLSAQGALLDGRCVAWAPLPNYPIADFSIAWPQVLLDETAAREAMRRARAQGRLLTRAAYDVYLSGNDLVYVNETCDPNETEDIFHLNVFPQRVDDLPDEWRERGFQRFRFEFHRRGALLEEGCVALFPLPDYPAAGFQTGQRFADGGNRWRAEFSANPERYRIAYRAAMASEPLARGVFDVYSTGDSLVYVKEPCEQADTEDRFYLHIVPVQAGDLPDERREHGFANLDFAFFLNGAAFDGKCAATVPLPEYAVESIRTGQFVSGEGEIWSAEFALAGRATPAHSRGATRRRRGTGR